MSKTNPDALRLLRRVRCFVLDMDGTFYLEDRPIEGALDFYEAARASGRRVLFLTNNSSKDGRHYVDKLNRMGCPVTQDDVYTSGMATCQMLRREYPGVPVYLLGNESLRGEFERYGIRCATGSRVSWWWASTRRSITASCASYAISYGRGYRISRRIPTLTARPLPVLCPTRARYSRLSRPRPAGGPTASSESPTPTSSGVCWK